MKNKNKNEKNAELKLHIKAALIFLSIIVLVGCQAQEIDEQKATEEVIEDITAMTSPDTEDLETIDFKSEAIREVTAYNVGDPYQTDDSPCIGAYNNMNLCEILAQGTNICATNAFKKGTKLRLKSLVSDWEMECEVWDRMNSRYTNRIDIAMGAHEKQRALKFGVQTLLVQELFDTNNYLITEDNI